jgi:hypothetical protein
MPDMHITAKLEILTFEVLMFWSSSDFCVALDVKWGWRCIQCWLLGSG